MRKRRPVGDVELSEEALRDANVAEVELAGRRPRQGQPHPEGPLGGGGGGGVEGEGGGATAALPLAQRGAVLR